MNRPDDRDDIGAAEQEPDGNPFLGLHPFEERDNIYFFGRDPQVQELLDRLGRQRFLAVVGTSASGKSSLVRAGLLPALHGGFMAGAGARWRIAVMRPGNAPIAGLANALELSGVLGEDGESAVRIGLARAVLERGELGLVELAEQARLRADENLLIVVDQFEELFRFKRDRDEAAAFVKLLLAAAARPGASIYVLLTMRSDFLGDCAQFRDLPQSINDGLFLVPRPTRDQLREAIEGPVGVAGAEISPLLVNRLLNELGDSPDQLPVLQHALMRTWDIWRERGDYSRPIDSTDFDATGGLAHALSKHGDDIYHRLPPDLRPVAERLFKALTDRGSDNRGIRRPTAFAELPAIVGATADDIGEVVEEFRDVGRSFLMPPPGVPLDGSSVVDISHESLMRVWKRLQQWVDEEAQSAQIYRRLAESAALHARGEAGLMRDPELSIALRSCEETHPNTAWAERYDPSFVDAMRFLESSADAREKEAAARALARRREVRNWRTFAAILIVCLCAMIVLVVVAVGKKTEADHQKAEADLQARVAAAAEKRAKLSASAAVAAKRDAVGKALESVASAARASIAEGVAKAEAANAAAQKKQADIQAAHARHAAEQAKQQAEIAKKERNNANGQAKLLASEAVELTAERNHALEVQSRFLARASGEEVDKGDAVTGMLLALEALPKNLARPDRPFVNEAAVALERAVANQQEIAVLRGHEGEVYSAAFSPDGKRIVSASSDGTARVWDATSGAPIAVLRGHDGPVYSAAFSPDGKRIVSASDDKTARVWDATSGAQIAVLRGHEDRVWSAAFSPDGKRIVSASWDKTARVWDATSGAPIAVLRGHDNTVYSATFSPDGKRIVSASWDKTVRVWDATSGAPIAVLRGHDGPVHSAAFSPDGKRIVSASDDKTARVWDATSGAPMAVLRGHGFYVTSAVFSPDGKRIVSASYDKTARVWDATSGAPIAVLRGHDDAVLSAAFSPDGKRIVSASDDKTARVWDATSGAPIAVLRGHDDYVSSALLPDASAAFSPDAKRIVSASDDKTVRVWRMPPFDQALIDAAHRAVPRQLSGNQRKQMFLNVVP